MTITHNLTLDLQKKGDLQRIDVVQGDAGTRLVELTLLSGTAPWEIPEQAQLAVHYLKPDGTSGIYDRLPDGMLCYSFADNVITMELAPQTLTCAGAVQMQVELSLAQRRIATFAFLIAVEQAVAADSESGDYVNWPVAFMPQTAGAVQGQYLQVADVDGEGRVLGLNPVDDPAAGVQQQVNDLERHLLAVGQRVEDTEQTVSEFDARIKQTVTKPQTAQVGQVLAVQAVDSSGSPTQWETVEQSKILYVDITHDGVDTGTMDKTYGEVMAALEAGRPIVAALYDTEKTFIASVLLSDAGDGFLSCSTVSLDSRLRAFVCYVVIYGGGVSMVNLPIVPDSLPNPEKLTINGQSYDGSGAVSVEIPCGWSVASEVVTEAAMSEISIALPIDTATKRFNYRFAVRVPPNTGAVLNTPAVVSVGNTDICHPVLMSDSTNEGTLFAEIYAYRGMAYGVWSQYGTGVVSHDHLDNIIATGELTTLRITAPDGVQFPAGTAVMVESMIVEVQ